MNRRTFAASLLAPPPVITQALHQYRVPAVTAIVASPTKILYSGSVGVPLNAIFSVASRVWLLPFAPPRVRRFRRQIASHTRASVHSLLTPPPARTPTASS